MLARVETAGISAIERRDHTDCRRGYWIRILIVVAIVLPVAAVALAGVPKKIKYQGRLTDNVTGLPLAGPHTLTLRIYNASSGGDLIWSETVPVGADSAGVFTTTIGSVNLIDVAFAEDCWLEVEADGEILSPRREMVSVPYAFRADEAGHASGADSLDGHSPGEFVLKGEASSITASMIIAGTGSSLDADMLDGNEASAFAAAVHVHDERYYTKSDLAGSGTINEPENPVDWTRLKAVPGGLADGVDDVGSGDGHSLDAVDGEPSDAVFVDGDGRVGIGTSTPARQLHVAGEGARVLVEAISGNAEVNLKTSGDGSGDVWAMYKHVTDGDLHFFRGGDKVTIAGATGNVGIGTASPEAKLDVAGAINSASEYRIDSKTVLAVEDNNRLHVGVAAGANNSGFWTVCIGDSAGYASIGNSSTFVGFATGTKCLGSENTFVGWRAGYSNTNAIQNTFVGTSAGENNSQGEYNTFIGAYAGNDNTVGGANVFVGEATGYDNVDGPMNTFVGRMAGSSNVGGSRNGFFGHMAGWKCESGDSNVYIGEGCGLKNETGSGNVFLGHSAGSNEMGSNKLYIANGHLDSNALIYGDFSTGRIGLGTLNPERKLHILGDAPRILIESTGGSPEINFENTDDATAQRWAIYKHSITDDLRFYQNGDRVTIQNGTGNVGIGTGDPGSYKLYVNGTACGTSAWGTCSDAGFKRDVRGISSALSKLLDVRGVSFEWNTDEFADKGFPAGRHYGVIAQEVERVLPEVVGSGPDGTKTVAYDELIPVLIESVKELKAENDNLRERLESLERAQAGR